MVLFFPRAGFRDTCSSFARFFTSGPGVSSRISERSLRLLSSSKNPVKTDSKKMTGRHHILLGPGKTRTHCGGNIADVIIFPPSICSEHKFCVLDTDKGLSKPSETFNVSVWCATMLWHFARDGQHGGTQCYHHNVSSFLVSILYSPWTYTT